MRRRPDVFCFAGTQRVVPTLAHVPGVEVTGRYRTVVVLRPAHIAPHGALRRPRILLAWNVERRLVHLGRGRVYGCHQVV